MPGVMYIADRGGQNIAKYQILKYILKKSNLKYKMRILKYFIQNTTNFTV